MYIPSQYSSNIHNSIENLPLFSYKSQTTQNSENSFFIFVSLSQLGFEKLLTASINIARFTSSLYTYTICSVLLKIRSHLQQIGRPFEYLQREFGSQEAVEYR